MDKESLIGKRIADINIDGCSVYLKTEDGLIFQYDASDGGYSTWEFYMEEDEM